MNGGHNIHSLTFGSGPKSGTGSPSPRPTGLHRHVSAAFQALAIGCREEAAVSGLIRGLEENGDLRVSLSSLSRGDRHKILSYVGEAHFAELSALAAEADAELFFEQLLNFWLRLDGEAQAEAQIAGLSLLAEASEGRMPAWIREKARREREARMGLGPAAPRAEFLLRHFAAGATDPSTIFPMLGASILGRTLKVGLLARLLGGSEAAWYSRGIGARMTAGFAAFQAETLVFALGHRSFHSASQGSLASEWTRSALGLGALKLGAALGGKATGLLRGSGAGSHLGRATLAPTSIFLGLNLAAQLEANLGLRPAAEPATLAVDSLAAMLSLGAGIGLGRRLLGPRFAAFEGELEWRSRTSGPAAPAGAWPPALAPAVGPRALTAARVPAVWMSALQEPGASVAPNSPGPVSSAPLRLPRKIHSSQGVDYPFDLLLGASKGLWRAEDPALVGSRLAIAERDGGTLYAKVEKHEVNRVGDPITPEGVLKVHLVLEEGATRGKAFVYVDRDSLTLHFVDLEETMITQGPPMRPGAGSIFFTWLAEQAKAEKKRFNVTRITSPQTVKILLKQNLMNPKNSCVEACTRIDPESYEEEYRIEARFTLGDQGAWARYRRQADFFNVYGDSDAAAP